MEKVRREEGWAIKFWRVGALPPTTFKMLNVDFGINTAIVGVIVFTPLTSWSLLRSSLTYVEGSLSCAYDLEENAGIGKEGMERWMDSSSS